MADYITPNFKWQASCLIVYKRTENSVKQYINYPKHQLAAKLRPILPQPRQYAKNPNFWRLKSF